MLDLKLFLSIQIDNLFYLYKMALYGGADVFELMKKMDIKDALNLGLTNKKAREITRGDRFWIFFLNRDYPYFRNMGEPSLEYAYRAIYADRRLDEYVMRPAHVFYDLRYLQNLIIFRCQNLGLISLEGCPPCEELYCSGNLLKDLKGCPGNVKKLRCSSNKLETLEGCPDSVEELDCYNNELTSLIGCGKNVENLMSNNNKLKSLKGCPDSVEILRCSSNKLKSLEGCGKNVKELSCSDNQLTSLVGCTSNIIEIYCGWNNLTSLEGCPTGVKTLNIGDSSITSLIDCPKSLIHLTCSDNRITSLDVYLPNIRRVTFINNPLIPPWNNMEEKEVIRLMRLRRW